jgi:16S rRNA (uracil1498-N3)-methyltransferase
MPRFFVAPGSVADNFAVLTGEDANHCKVLRLGKGDAVTLCDGQGTDYSCVISDMSPGQVCLVVRSADPSHAEPGVEATIYMAFAKADKFEHVIQKATELGACRIVAFPSARCVSKPDSKSLQKKLERWQKIAEAAAKQSGRGRIPQVTALASYGEALSQAAQAELAVFFYENAHSCTFRAALEARPARTVSLMTGPEGGFEPEEVTAAEQAGLVVCSLGSRILRCETAPLCAISALLYHHQEL